MKRVLIIGSPGAGKSYLSRQLTQSTDLPLYHLDQMYWKPGWVERTREELIERINAVLPEDSWIIEGMYRGTLDLRLQRADTVLFLDYNYMRCLWGVIRRTLGSLNKVRPDMAEGCPERFDIDFFKYIGRFHKKDRFEVLEILEPYKSSKNIITFKKPKDVRQWLTTLA
jgi:adenylate kinase family enzyme